jgi:hypothetical protein
VFLAVAWTAAVDLMIGLAADSIGGGVVVVGPEVPWGAPSLWW